MGIRLTRFPCFSLLHTGLKRSGETVVESLPREGPQTFRQCRSAYVGLWLGRALARVDKPVR